MNKWRVALFVLSAAISMTGLVLFSTGLAFRLQSGWLGEQAVRLLNNIDVHGGKFGVLGLAAALTNIICGLLMAILGGMGVIGGYLQIKRVYMFLMVTLLVFIVVHGVMVWLWVSLRGQTDDYLRGRLENLISHYTGVDGSAEITQGWNELFIYGRCCGANNQYSSGTNNDFNDFSSPWYSIRGLNNIPPTCCEGVTEDNVDNYDASASCTTPSPPINFYSTGCYHRIKDTTANFALISFVFCGFGIFIKLLSLVATYALVQADGRIQQVSRPVRENTIETERSADIYWGTNPRTKKPAGIVTETIVTKKKLKTLKT